MSLSARDMLKIMEIFKDHQLHSLQLKTGPQTLELRKDVQPSAAEPQRRDIVVHADRMGMFRCNTAEGQRVAGAQQVATLAVLDTLYPLTVATGGVVQRVLVAQDELVEYGQPLMVLTAQEALS